jgi:glutaminyl-peptide cyclotransferase
MPCLTPSDRLQAALPALSALLVLLLSAAPLPAVDTCSPEIISARVHDSEAFTQGLLLHQGYLFESTGLYGSSSVRRVMPDTGEVVQQLDLDAELFGEGLALVDDRLFQLTFLAGAALVYDRDSFSALPGFSYVGEGWGLCYDGRRLVMSDGSDRLTFRSAMDFSIEGSVSVTIDGAPRDLLNELECVGDLVYANVFTTDQIVRIDPDTGAVLTLIDASGLLTPEEQQDASVLNGIAFDPTSDRFFLTGKLWPWVFEATFDFNPYSAQECVAADLELVTGVRVAKRGASAVSLSWLPVPGAFKYHVNSVSQRTALEPPAPHRPDLVGGTGAARCDAAWPATGCLDPEALAAPDPLLYYQVFAACGPGGVHEGP